MPSFGEKLKLEREKRKITLEQISVSTKIGTRMLQALEEDRFNQLPGGIFNKGFVRAYSRFIGLDEDQVVADYLKLPATRLRFRPKSWIADPTLMTTAHAKRRRLPAAWTPSRTPLPAGCPGVCSLRFCLSSCSFFRSGVVTSVSTLHRPSVRPQPPWRRDPAETADGTSNPAPGEVSGAASPAPASTGEASSTSGSLNSQLTH